jgi:hypothetical protein
MSIKDVFYVSSGSILQINIAFQHIGAFALQLFLQNFKAGR